MYIKQDTVIANNEQIHNYIIYYLFIIIMLFITWDNFSPTIIIINCGISIHFVHCHAKSYHKMLVNMQVDYLL